MSSSYIVEEEWKEIVKQKSQVPGDFCMKNIISPSPTCFVWKTGNDETKDPTFIDISNWLFNYREKPDSGIEKYTFPQLVSKIRFGYEVESKKVDDKPVDINNTLKEMGYNNKVENNKIDQN